MLQQDMFYLILFTPFVGMNMNEEQIQVAELTA